MCFDLNDQLFCNRHTAAHVLAQAVIEVFPDAKLGIGPPINDGFYYDFDLPRPITDEDLPDIEERMKRIIREDQIMLRRNVTNEEAKALFANQPYKLEIIELIQKGGLSDNLEKLDGPQALSIYENGPLVDLCRGPHAESTGAINVDALKLTRFSGAYWRGDDSRPMLQRIYGTLWNTKEELDLYLIRLEEAKKRDHRSLGRRLDLFSTSEAVGPGLVLWHPKGGLVRYLFDRFSQEAHILNGYQWVYTPHIGRAGLWETSGHLKFFKDAMYSPIELDDEQYYLKPMSCPFHIQIYKNRPRSYRELPMRLAEFATVYRFEKSGALHGMTRVRGFTQDDAHTFCTKEQLPHEIRHALRFSLYVLRTMGLSNFIAYVATKPEQKAIGAEDDWERAIATLKVALEEEGIPYRIDEGGGAFYGPKIDLKVRDSLAREWQLSTVQYDFNLPERFNMTYIGSDGAEYRPFMVHRALFGSAERFFAMLIEHYNGAFPLWLAPVQVTVIPITNQQLDYARSIEAHLKREGLRVSVDDRSEKMQAKIRDAQMERIPYILVLGKREVENKEISVRDRSEGDLGTMSVEAFLEMTYEARRVGIATELS